MKTLRLVARGALCISCVLALHCGGASASASAPHDRAFWRSIASHGYAVPSGQSASSLTWELNELLGSPDPELRDDLAYSIVSNWITERRALTPAELTKLLAMWRTNLKNGIGESGTDSVLRRSFSVLGLALIAERDSKEPFLTAEDYRGLLDDALAYLNAERDLRGFDPKKGWMHATAHTADLIAALGANPRLASTDQVRILSSIETRLSSAPSIYLFDEPDRLAEAAMSLVRRPDSDIPTFQASLHRLHDILREARGRPHELHRLAVWQNTMQFLRSLFVGVSVENLSPRALPCRAMVLEILKAP